MNRKGITLIEFIISVALVGIVMLFLFNLLIDVQYMSKNGDFASDNQLNRASIIKTVMEDFTLHHLVGMEDHSTFQELILTFHYQDGSEKVLTVGNNYVLYGNDEEKERWSMRSSNGKDSYQTSCANYHFERATCCTDCDEEKCSNYFYLHIRIPVVVSNKNTNAIDDLDFFYVGDSAAINDGSFPSKSFLGYESNTCSL